MPGQGGAGKTTLASAIVRDPEVLSAFDAALWLTVGEAPDIPQMQRALLAQLEPGAAPDKHDGVPYAASSGLELTLDQQSLAHSATHAFSRDP